MPPELPLDQLLGLRLRSQLLTGARPAQAGEVVRALVGVQTQVVEAARLAVRVRSHDVRAADVTRATNQDRTIIRTWTMRGTLHMLRAEDAAWIVPMLGPLHAARDARRRSQLGLDEAVCARALPAMVDGLAANGPLTRSELMLGLARRGVTLDRSGQAPAHLLFLAAARGLVCRGPDRDGDEPTYVLLEDWIGPLRPLPADEALCELARRYLRGYGPAGAADFAAWSGLGAPQARRAFQLIRPELNEVLLPDGPGAMLRGFPEPETAALPQAVRLLPHFDSYLLGYRSRATFLQAEFARRVQAGGGWIHPTLSVGGRIEGTWRLRRGRRDARLEVRPFRPLAAETIPALESETADLGRFLGLDARLDLLS